MAYQVGIDLGTTSTVAAVTRGDGTAHVVPLEGPTGAVASAVYLGADGTLLVGEAAQRRALSDPGRVVRELTHRIGDGTPLLVGREPVAAADLAARFLARLVDDVARREGGVAARVAVTHPGSWGPHRLESLRAALREHGLASAVLVPAPVAAVVAHAAAAPLPPGATVGVYDLGGGRFEASVVRGFALAAPSEELEFGGADLDEAVFTHVRDALGAAWEALDPTDPEVLAAVADLRRECTAAKEALSRDTEVLVPVALPGVRTQVRLGRAEFEEMIRADVDATVEALRRALDDAGASPPAALVVVGGSARVPLVPQLLGEAFGREVTVAADPVGAVALGAALLAGGGGRRAAAGRAPGRPAAVPVAPAARVESRAPAPSALASATAPGTTVLPVARPPKQARPFTAGTAEAPSRPRRIVLLASAGALALAVLGGVVAFGVGRVGAASEADAGTPATVVSSGVAVPPAAVPPPPAPGTRERSGSPPASRRARQAPPAVAPSAPPTTTAPAATTPPPPPPPPPKPSAPPETAAPADDGGGNGGGEAGVDEGEAAGGGAGGTGDAADAPAVAPAAPAAQADDAAGPATGEGDAAQ